MLATKTIRFLLLLFALAVVLPVRSFAGLCEENFALVAAKYPQAFALAGDLEAFAVENKLPMKVMEFGPPERRVKRLVVGLDATNEELMKKYLKRFNLEKGKKGAGGVLALEFQHEIENNYVTGVLRPSSDPNAQIYRWGRPDLKRSDWWEDWMVKDDRPVIGYAHLIGLNDDEAKNVRTYLKYSDVDKANPQVAKCKTNNCVAWTSGIELGVTKEGATDEERKFLFNELGIARSSAHFEIGRRLANAANDRHTGMIVFLNGKEGKKAFAGNLEEYMPKAPKIAYTQIIRGLGPDVEIQKALSVVPDGGKVFFPIAAGASPEAMGALIEHTRGLKEGLDIHVLVNGVSEATLKKGVAELGDKFRLHALFLGGNMRDLYKEGKINVIPGYLGDFTKMMKDPAMEQFHYDAIVVRVAPADAKGRYSLGPNHDMIMEIIKNRPGIKVIAEVNENVPRTLGDNFLTEDQITTKFFSKAQLAGPPVVPLTDVEKNIGKNLASLIPNDANLQVGIGNIFGGLPAGLAAKKRQNIRIFTEMFGDPLKELVERGIAKDAETGFAYGSTDLYKWLDGNKKVRFVSTEVVNNPGAVAQKENFHAVNTALQVNLLGDVNATIGPEGRRISSPGGQMEFMTGAARSKGGKSIIAIRSTAKNGELSTIALDLYPGPVTTPHENVTHVVTEYGVAKLQGVGEHDRAIALINVAHPKFREELFEKAVQRGMLREEDRVKIEGLQKKPKRRPKKVGVLLWGLEAVGAVA